MPLRIATWTDLLAASHAASGAFFEESLFGPVIHPHRHTYPNDVYLFFLRYFRQTFFSATDTIIVTYPSHSPSTVTGVGVWTRKGAGGVRLAKQQGWTMWLTGKLFVGVNRLHAWLYPNRAADPANVDVLERSYAWISHYWMGERADSWYVNLLATDPAFEKMGYGRLLVSWGTQRAREEGVCASLISAEGREGFYRKCGFEGPVGWASEGVDNPIANVSGGAIMFTEAFKQG